MNNAETKFKLGPNQIKWIEALKSGEYKQGKNRLQTGDQYCCLGVACSIFADELGLVKSEEIEDEGISTIVYNEDYTVIPPKSVIDHLALNSQWGDSNKEWFKPLTRINDNSNNFNNVIEVIEKTPELYFKESK